MSKKSDDYIDKAFENITEDREKLKELFDEISKVAKLQSDALGLAGVGENLVKITDSLTKQTNQLVELAKLKQRAELTKESNKDDEKLTGHDILDIMAEIESDDLN